MLSTVQMRKRIICIGTLRQVRTSLVVMSKTKGQTFGYRFGNETKTFWQRSRICLFKRYCFNLVQNLLFWTKKKLSLSLGKIRERTQKFWFHSYQILERLWNICKKCISWLQETVHCYGFKNAVLQCLHSYQRIYVSCMYL